MKADIIKLEIPKKPKYISVARLAISGLSYDLGLTIEDIEDIKICIGEACINVLSNENYRGNISMEFEVKDSGIYMSVKGVDENLEGLKEELGLLLIESLMDQVVFTDEGMEMVKHFKDDAHDYE